MGVLGSLDLGKNSQEPPSLPCPAQACPSHCSQWMFLLPGTGGGASQGREGGGRVQ